MQPGRGCPYAAVLRARRAREGAEALDEVAGVVAVGDVGLESPPFAERLARPLLILAEGTQAVAAGDFTPRSVVASDDELGVLTQSFSKMTRQLDDARRETERHRQQVEAASAYLESVLANLSAGVLASNFKSLTH